MTGWSAVLEEPENRRWRPAEEYLDERWAFSHSFQSLIVVLAMSLTAARSHLPDRLFRSEMIRCVARVVPRWTFAVSQAMA